MIMQMRKRTVLGIVWVLVAVAAGVCQDGTRPIVWAQPVASDAVKNWFKVDNGVFRSSQPDRKGFEEARRRGVRSILNLRGEHYDASLAGGLGLMIVDVPMSAGSFSESDIVKALRAIRSAPKPVLIH